MKSEIKYSIDAKMIANFPADHKIWFNRAYYSAVFESAIAQLGDMLINNPDSFVINKFLNNLCDWVKQDKSTNNLTNFPGGGYSPLSRYGQSSDVFNFCVLENVCKEWRGIVVNEVLCVPVINTNNLNLSEKIISELTLNSNKFKDSKIAELKAKYPDKKDILPNLRTGIVVLSDLNVSVLLANLDKFKMSGLSNDTNFK